MSRRLLDLVLGPVCPFCRKRGRFYEIGDVFATTCCNRSGNMVGAPPEPVEREMPITEWLQRVDRSNS